MLKQKKFGFQMTRSEMYTFANNIKLRNHKPSTTQAVAPHKLLNHTFFLIDYIQF